MHIPIRRLTGGVLLAVVVACGGGDSTGPKATPPAIAAVSPARGTVGTELTVTGTGFRNGATVRVGSLAATDVQVASPTTLYAKVPAGVVAGQVYAVTVSNSDGGAVTYAAAFTPVAPTLLYVNGATRPSANAGSTVILEGEAFGDVQGTGQVLFSDGAGGTLAATIASPDDWTDTFILTTLPSGAGTGEVKIRTATGTSAAITLTLASNAQFSPSTIQWTKTTSMPAGVSGHSAAFAVVQGATAANNFVYVTGGGDDANAPRATVWSAGVLGNGQVGAWASQPALPAGRAFHASVVATPFNSRVKGAGYLYVLGGSQDAAGTPTTTVYRAPLTADGGLGTWESLGALPAPLHSTDAVIFRGEIYIAGGSTTGNAPVATVYRSRLDSLGALGPWQTLTALPSARTYHGLTQFGGYLYVFGGESAALAPNDASAASSATRLNEVAYARIDLRTGAITPAGWVVNSSSLTKAVGKHTSVVAGGSVLVTGGLYNGASTGSSEESYAQLRTDGTVSSFSGATGSHTITSAGGSNLFNHAALSYVDANGVAHVLVLGGDDVNAPGKKRAEVWFY
jgi:N-acetylneuraminic acid mutarotase